MLYNKLYPLVRNILAVFGFITFLIVLFLLIDFIASILSYDVLSNVNSCDMIKNEIESFRSSIIYSICTFCLFVFGNWVRNRYYSARFLGCNNNTPFYIKINYYEHIIPFLEIDTRQVNDNNNISVRHRYVTSYDDYLAQCSIISYLNELSFVVKYEGATNIHNENLVVIGSSNPIFIDLVHQYNIIFERYVVDINQNVFSPVNSVGDNLSYCLIFKYHPESNLGKSLNTWLVVGGLDQYSTRAGAKMVAERNQHIMSKISIWKSWILLHHYFHVRNTENMVILVCCRNQNPDLCDIAGVWCSVQNGLERLY